MTAPTAPPCAALRVLLGVYVLGSIDPAERALVDRHLAGCASCREELASLAGVPGLLGRLTAFEVAALADRPEGESRLLDRVLAAAAADHRRARSRRVLAAVAAVVLLASGIGAGALLTSSRRTEPPAPAAVVLSTTAGAITVRAGLTPKGWGTSVNLQLSGVPGGRSCQLIADGRDGRSEVAASYASTATGEMTVTGATGIKLADITALRIVDTNGYAITLPR